mgnify:CR=1 FL=1
MAIPKGTKFHGVNKEVDTVNKGSQQANSKRDAYTIDDIVDYVEINLPEQVNGIFTQISNGTPVTNSTDETSIIGNGIGSLSVPANGFVKGNTFKCYIEGELSSENNETLTINIKDNGNILASSGQMELVSTSENYYQIQITFVIREVGAAGVASIMTSGTFNYTKISNNSSEVISFEENNNTTFDTTQETTLNITAQWGQASVSNSIDTHILTLQRIF